jgi:putative nucleotidyltransferase with HDIG domain
MIYEGAKNEEHKAEIAASLMVRVWIALVGICLALSMRLLIMQSVDPRIYALLGAWLLLALGLRAWLPALGRRSHLDRLHLSLFAVEALLLAGLCHLSGPGGWAGYMSLAIYCVLAHFMLAPGTAWLVTLLAMASFSAVSLVDLGPMSPVPLAGLGMAAGLGLAVGKLTRQLRRSSGKLKGANERLQALHDESTAKRTTLLQHQDQLMAANERLKRQNEELSRSHEVILTLATAVESKDNYTAGHSLRVAAYSLQLAKALNLPLETQRIIKNGSILHDVGKINVSDLILRKAGPLNEEEFDTMRQHPATGEKIVRPLQFCRPYLDIIRHHHERMDGKGYPDRLPGHKISLEARIVAIADAFDAMTSDRSYRPRMPVAVAFARLREYADLQWDGDLVRTFIQAMEAQLKDGELPIHASGSMGLAAQAQAEQPQQKKEEAP